MGHIWPLQEAAAAGTQATELIPVNHYTLLQKKLNIRSNISFSVQETQGSFSRMHFQLSPCYSIFTALTISVVAESILGIHFEE